jgi:GNAT superfamily N-acetyltransferase
MTGDAAMNIIQLNQENADQFGFGCMLKGNLYIRRPQPFRETMLPALKSHLNRDIFGFVAEDQNRPAGHILLGKVEALGLPVRIEPDIPVILCTYLSKGYHRLGIGRSLIEAAKNAFSEEPGLLVMSTRTKIYMPFQKFEKMGFQRVADYDLWRAGYLPIKQEHIQIQFFDPVLEWDYIKPFTLVRGGFCPFLLYQWEAQLKAVSVFKQYLPVEEMTLQEARKRDPQVLPGFYVFGNCFPAKPMFRWQIRRLIRKAIHDEEKKTFGAAARTDYEKRKE